MFLYYGGCDIALGGREFEAKPLSESVKQRIGALAIFSARCRSNVERHGYTREIELIPQPESPSRLAKQLSMLYLGMLAIGTTQKDAWRVLTKVACDCIPPVRYRALAALANVAGELETAIVAEKIGYPSTTTRRALEELEAHRVVSRRSGSEGQSAYWAVSEWGREQLAAIRSSVPEKSYASRSCELIFRERFP